MNKLEIFKNSEYEIRVALKNDEPYFCLVDVCKILDIGNSRQAKTRLNLKGVITNDTLTNGGIQQIDFINESNLYKLIFQSRKVEAEKFTDWVTSEVIPSIRKHGGYLTEQKIDEILDSPDTIIALATKLKEERAKSQSLEIQIKQDAPYVTYAKAVEASASSCQIGEYVKVLCDDDGVNVGRNRLFKWLRKKGYLMNDNMPYQKWIDRGYFEVMPLNIVTSKGNLQKFTTYITTKGQVALSPDITNEFREIRC